MKFNKFGLIIVLLCLCATSYAQAQKGILEIRKDSVVDYKNPKRYLLKDIKLLGIESINTKMMLNSVGLHVGDSISIPSETLSNALKKLWAFKLYSDVKVYMQTSEDDLYLELRMMDRPFVSSWDITGISSAQKRELLETLNLTQDVQFSEYLIQSSSKAIKEFYEKKGFFNATITPRIIQDTLKFRNRMYVKVDFAVDKKKKVKIQDISFDGISGDITSNKLKSEMKNNKEKRLKNFFKGSKLKEDKIKEDEDNIILYLQSMGYRNAAVLSDSIYVISDQRVGIKFNIYQGEKYYYRNITWTGNEKYPVEYLNQLIHVKKGEVYDSKNLKVRLGLDMMTAMQKGIPNVSALYADDGYLESSVHPVEIEIAKDTVDIEIKIYEGKQFSLNKVIIKGNTRTHDKVIRRELFTRPGEIYSQRLLLDSRQMIGSMGNFDVNVYPEFLMVPGSDDKVDVIWNLEESSTDKFSFSGGYGAGTFVLGVGVTFKNLSLRKFFKKGAWKPYPSGDNQQFNMNIQSNGIYYKNISVSLLEPWLGGKKPNSLSVSMYYSDQTNGMTVFDAGTSRFATLGASVGYGTRLSWPDQYFTFVTALNYQNYNMTNWSNFVIENGISHIISLSATLARKSINSPYYPSAGSDFSVSVEATPPYSLFKKEGYYDQVLTEQQRYKFVEYYKVSLKAKWYQALTPDNKLVLHFAANFGYLGHYNKNAKSPFEGYSVGGSGLGGYNLYGIEYVSLRGYKDGSLTPYADYGEQAKVYSKYTAEVRYPFVQSPGTTMFALIFAEAGNVANDWNAFNPFELKKSAGIGLRIFLPIVGMFGIDFGYGFDRLPGEADASGFEFHFSMGQEF